MLFASRRSVSAASTSFRFGPGEPGATSSVSRAIARRLGRSVATIRREIARHGGRGRYRAAEADRRVWDNARRPRRCKLALHPAFCKLVACELSEDWSPEQIAGWRKLGSPEDHTCRVSHETIDQTPFIQTRGALKRELLLHLRRAGSAGRRSRRASMPGGGRSVMPSRFESAHRRPRTVRFPVTWGRGTCLRGRRLEGLEGGGDPGTVLLPAPGPWIARMRAASETRNLLLCPTDQATGHS